MRRLVLIAVAALAVAAPATGAVGPRPIAADPLGAAAPGRHATIAEPDSLSVGNTVVSVFQVGRNFGGGAAAIGWATSADGGVTWQNGLLPGLTPFSTPGGPYTRVSDPAVAYSRVHGVWLASVLALRDVAGVGTSAIVTLRSADGVTWTGPHVTAPDVGSFTHDKNWIVCDGGSSPFAGRCYTVWTDVPSGRLTVSTSLDGGLTWRAAVAAVAAPGNGALPLVLPNGTLVVPYRTFGASLAVAISADGGATLTQGAVIGPAAAGTIAGLRSPPLPSGEVGGDGRIHLAWHTCAFRSGCTGPSPSAPNDLALSSSADGVTWTQPRRLELASGGGLSRVLPGLGVDATSSGGGTRLALVHYEVTPLGCVGDACSIRPLFTYSQDAGATWSRPLALASPMRLSWVVPTSQGRMLGDYFSTSFVGDGVAVPVFIAARPPQGPLFRQDLYSASIGPLPAARALTLSATRLSVFPRRARPGATLRATLRVSRSDLGAQLDGRATCGARMRGRALPVLTSRTRGLVVECSWRIPRGRVGPIAATIGVRVDEASVVRRFRVA